MSASDRSTAPTGTGFAAAVPELRATPDLSVILPLQDPRGQAEACVRRWVREQTLPRERYEVVLVTPGIAPELERRVAGLLGPGDRLVSVATRNEWAMNQAGAEASTGRLLFFTEAHCVGERTCLEETLRFLEGSPYVGARVRSDGVSRSPLAELERQVFDESLQVGEEPGHWRKVLIHGFAIDRDVYLDTGGFEARYGDFAGWALALKLRERGMQLGYMPRAGVQHEYLGKLVELLPHLRDFAHGELAYRATRPAVEIEPYIGEAEEWTDRRSLERRTALRMLRTSLIAIRTTPAGGHSRRERLGLVRAALRYAATALLGARAPLARASARLAARWARLHLWARDPESRLPAYREWWQAAVGAFRLERLLRHPPPTSGPPQQRLRFDLSAKDDGALAGFSISEGTSGTRFRWTGPVGLVESALPPGFYRVVLDVVPLRAPDSVGLVAVLDGTRLPQASYRIETDRISIPLRVVRSRRRGNWLALACSPLRPRKLGQPDDRELGLAVRAITFERQ